MTSSIVARDPAAGQIGAAVQSAWFGTATGVLLVEPGVGAAVSQAMGERAFAHRALELRAEGRSSADALSAVMSDEPNRARSQVALIDLDDLPVVYTGADCIPHADDFVGLDCSAQSNMMQNPGVPEAMVSAFEASNRDLVSRLLDALDAAQELGGDFRGVQSAGLVVRTASRDTPVWNSTVMDLRVDDHPDPLHELRRLAELNRLYRWMNQVFVRLAAGDVDGAVTVARRAWDSLPTDPNVQMRYAVALLAGGDQQGAAILSRLASANEHWITYARRTLQRYGIDSDPLLEPWS